tara:strand:- start:18817 stop:20607 length:1791 start_codon:yes stop_codon:yes gene_type:complete
LINNNFLKRKVSTNKQSLVSFVFTSFTFFLIILRLIFLQLINNENFKKMSDDNRIRLIATQPIRGKILDRNGRTLVDNRLNYSLIIKPQFVNNQLWEEYKYLLSTLLQVKSEDLEIRYQNGLKKQAYFIKLLDNLTIENLIKFEENQSLFPGIEISRRIIRNYPYKSLGAHVIGYISPITDKEYTILSKKGYRINDYIGRTGIEHIYEDELRGEWGGEMIEVNAAGIVQQSLGTTPSKKGTDIKLTIDLDLQLMAEEVLQDKKGGAIIALDPRNGSIRAMASKPTFDLNFFSKDFKPEKEFNRLFFSSTKPLLNRALNAYDPGSVWKIVTALAGLETGKFPADTLLETKPCITYGSQCFREHNDLGFGKIGYEDALRVSSNTFFYQIGYGVGVDAINKISKQLGFSKLTGIELSLQENQGLIASSDWAKKGRGWGEPGKTPWIPEDIASMSIGQFVVQVTPMQIARAYAAVANGGYLITPHVSLNKSDDLIKAKIPKIDITPEHINIIKSGLRKVVESGTGASINYGTQNLPTISGKTGTAEDANGGPDHAWFVCYSPSDKSELLVVAFAENTPGGGSVHALPMARKILEVWSLNN